MPTILHSHAHDITSTTVDSPARATRAATTVSTGEQTLFKSSTFSPDVLIKLTKDAGDVEGWRMREAIKEARDVASLAPKSIHQSRNSTYLRFPEEQINLLKGAAKTINPAVAEALSQEPKVRSHANVGERLEGWR